VKPFLSREAVTAHSCGCKPADLNSQPPERLSGDSNRKLLSPLHDSDYRSVSFHGLTPNGTYFRFMSGLGNPTRQRGIEPVSSWRNIEKVKLKIEKINWALASYLTTPTRLRIGVYNFATASCLHFCILHFSF
jgi:hypothetical protein